MKINSITEAVETEVSHNPKIKKKVLVSSGEIERITNFSRAVFPAGEVVEAHRHSDMTEVFFVESGEGVISIDGSDVSLKPGACVTVEPNEHHALRNTGVTELVLLYFGVETP